MDVEALDAIEVSASPLSLDEAQRIISRIEDVVRDRHVVLVGGQAVSVWIGQLEDRLGDKLTTAPVVSRDIDFLGNTADLGEAAIRDVLKLNERIFRFAQEDRCSRLAAERGVEAFDAVLDDERLPEKFRTVRLPQMQKRIRSLREGLAPGIVDS